MNLSYVAKLPTAGSNLNHRFKVNFNISSRKMKLVVECHIFGLYFQWFWRKENLDFSWKMVYGWMNGNICTWITDYFKKNLKITQLSSILGCWPGKPLCVFFSFRHVTRLEPRMLRKFCCLHERLFTELREPHFRFLG